jgi:transposase InsO family protein
VSRAEAVGLLGEKYGMAEDVVQAPIDKAEGRGWVSAARRGACVQHVVAELDISERFACKVLGQHRSTQRRVPRAADDEAALAECIVGLARQYGRYGYRRITALLRAEGWQCNHKRVERIWRREGQKVPSRQPRRGRLWLADASCVRLRPERPNHVWAYDFVEDRTPDGRKFRMLTVVDEFTHECLAIRVGRQLRAADVIHVLSDLFILRGVPGHVRSDNRPLWCMARPVGHPRVGWRGGEPSMTRGAFPTV